MADLFECFGSDDDSDAAHDNDNDNTSSSSTSKIDNERHSTKEKQIRHPDCGVCSQLNAEKSLLMHVKNTVMTGYNKRTSGGDDVDEIISRCDYVQTTIDDFCEQRAWMMHIGPEKGLIIQETLMKKLNNFVNNQNSEDCDKDEGNKKKDSNGTAAGRKEFICVELGTYCGYGSVWLAKTIYEFSKNHGNIDFHLFTIEVNPTFVDISKEMIGLCKLNDYVTILENEFMLDGTVGDVGSLLKNGIITNYVSKDDDGGNNVDCSIDFLLIDHDKDSYLSDLKRLEDCRMVRKGTVVAADNVIFAKIDKYVSYMKDLHKKGIVSTKTMESLVEYSTADILNNVEKETLFKDGIEISEYLITQGKFKGDVKSS